MFSSYILVFVLYPASYSFILHTFRLLFCKIIKEIPRQSFRSPSLHILLLFGVSPPNCSHLSLPSPYFWIPGSSTQWDLPVMYGFLLLILLSRSCPQRECCHNQKVYLIGFLSERKAENKWLWIFISNVLSSFLVIYSRWQAPYQ